MAELSCSSPLHRRLALVLLPGLLFLAAAPMAARAAATDAPPAAAHGANFGVPASPDDAAQPPPAAAPVQGAVGEGWG